MAERLGGLEGWLNALLELGSSRFLLLDFLQDDGSGVDPNPPARPERPDVRVADYYEGYGGGAVEPRLASYYGAADAADADAAGAGRAGAHAGVPLCVSTFSRAVWSLYGGAKGLVIWY